MFAKCASALLLVQLLTSETALANVVNCASGSYGLGVSGGNVCVASVCGPPIMEGSSIGGCLNATSLCLDAGGVQAQVGASGQISVCPLPVSLSACGTLGALNVVDPNSVCCLNQIPGVPQCSSSGR